MLSIDNQVFVVIQSLLLGGFLDILYELHSSFAVLFNLRKPRNKFKYINNISDTKKSLTRDVCSIIWDVMYFLKITPLCAIFLFGTNNGILRWYSVASAAIGFALVKQTLGRLINFLLEGAVCIFKKYIISKLRLCIAMLISKLKFRKTPKIKKRRVIISINEKQG